jgi:hypothetical protein
MSKAPDLTIPTHSAGSFSWQGTRGIAEASSLGDTPTRRFKDRVWSDACDEGFWMVSPRTGQRLLFVQVGPIWHSGELVGWEFKAEGARNTITVAVYND